MTLTLRCYLLFCANSVATDWCECTLELPRELEEDIKLAAMEGLCPEDFAPLSELIDSLRPNIAEEILNRADTASLFPDEDLPEAGDPDLELNIDQIEWRDLGFSNEDIEDMFRTMAVNPGVYDYNRIEDFIENAAEGYTGDRSLICLLDELAFTELSLEYCISVDRPAYWTDPEEITLDVTTAEAALVNAAIFDGLDFEAVEALEPLAERARQQIIESGVLEDIEFDFDDDDDFDPEDYYTIDLSFRC